MCDPIGYTVGFAPNQAPPPGYLVERAWDQDGGTEIYAATEDATWVGPPAKDRWEARRHAIAHAAGEWVDD